MSYLTQPNNDCDEQATEQFVTSVNASNDIQTSEKSRIMKGLTPPLCILFSACALSAQQADPDGFSLNFQNTLQVTQTTMSNWAAGGESSASTYVDLNLDGRYIRGRSALEIVADWKLGLYKTEGEPVQRIQDQLEVTAGYVYQLRTGLSTGAHAELSTQVAPSYPVEGTKGGDFLSPATLHVGVPFLFVYWQRLNLILSPATLKQTVILDEDVRALDTPPNFLYGNEGKTFRSEVGAYQRLRFTVPLMENVSAESDLKFFLNYSDVDVDTYWELELIGKMNENLAVSLNTILIYDNDTDTDLTALGKQNRVQFSEVFGVQLTHTFQIF
jgi:hypothetical protein